MAENVRVVVRCRPMNGRERDMKSKNIVHIRDCAVCLENTSDLSAPPKEFTYDNAYGVTAPTEALYNDICYSLIENVLEGYNGTIFAYGQTGCGKSHTMQGPDIQDSLTSSSQRGIISRSFDHIFEAISVATDVQYLALVSYLEIYNENIRDLLNPNENVTNLQLKEIPGEGVIVQNLSTHTVHNAKECEDLLRVGSKNRIVGATLMNAGSSRSHSIFTINLEQIETKAKPDDSDSTPGIRKGKLNLVDLAGSERQNKTGATGERLKEATKINLSLSALGNVISALVDGKTKHIPYRDSKLTRLLQDSLGGNTKTLMIACISPADYNYDETLSTLRYASRAKNIHNKPKINEDPKDTMLREYQQEIMQLRKLLESSQERVITADDAVAPEFDQNEWLETERIKLRAEYETETMRLKTEHDAQQKEKEELVKDMERLKTHYENQLKDLSNHPVEQNNNNLNNINLNGNFHESNIPVIQQEAFNRIEVIKNALIGGERANDVQLKEKRYKKKLAAQRRLSALAQALSRVEQTSDRDFLQEHYTDIQHELKFKTDSLRLCRQKVRALEREVSDLQSEFQLDRADYLETIRRLERNLKFYQQLLEKALPILRKDGKYWDPDSIQHESTWNDDIKKWKLPEDSMTRLRLPPAEPNRTGRESATSLTAPGRLERSTPPQHRNNNSLLNSPVRQSSIERINDNSSHGSRTGNIIMTNSLNNNIDSELDKTDYLAKKLQSEDSNHIADSYFRPRRATELMHQRKGFANWRDFTAKSKRFQAENLNSTWINSSSSNTINNNSNNNNNGMLGSWLLPQTNTTSLNKTWCGLSVQNFTSSPSSATTAAATTATSQTIGHNEISSGLMVLPSPHHRLTPQLMSSSPPMRIKSTGRLMVMGQQRRPRRLKALPTNRRLNT